ncbi:LiaI-LiaF-like domain-containing protein [Brevibacillus fluminis]|uniref:LiaI-LiaF-like domain-containing protein n=1 Tax=Brevibacillus fluminis TaxID=511487 RepID=UPI003F8A746D
MTKWRVGSVSMGVSLILLGLLFFFSRTDAKIMTNLLMSWWPVVFILLGVEILLYVFLSKSEKVTVHYDVFSILFVGFIGTMCIGTTLFASVGLLAEVQETIGSVEMTKPLPTIQQAVPQNVSKIVVQTAARPIRVEGNAERNVRLFGEYRERVNVPAEAGKQGELAYASVQTIGEVMYVNLHDLPRKTGINGTDPNEDVTIVLPQSIDVEIRGEHNDIEVATGRLQSNWAIDTDSSVKVQVAQQADVRITAISALQPEAGNLKWASVTQDPPAKPEAPDQENASEPEAPRAFVSEAILGKGTHRLQVIHANDVTVNQL